MRKMNEQLGNVSDATDFILPAPDAMEDSKW